MVQEQEARQAALAIINQLADMGATTADAKMIFEICNEYLSAVPIPHIQRKNAGV